ncbi:MAG: YoaP domain-containing protein [Ignavibacteriales bacterium]|nr:MAG: YoaP domain-containing protein [Ignavibacteriales bacterium]
MNNEIEIIDITENNILNYGICGYKSLKREGFPEKVSWIKENSANGLKIKSILTNNDGVQGMIEYMPAEYAWRPVDAKGYMFIQCVFTGFTSKYKNKGYGGKLIDECIADAKAQKKNGVVVVTRQGSFMIGSEIFLKKDFKVADKAEPDFELLVLKFKKSADDPKFKNTVEENPAKYKTGLTILRANQCPYTVKNVNEIVEASKSLFKITPKVIDIKSAAEAQTNPCAFGAFSIIYKGEIISHHPVSKTRFINIMNSILN